MLRLKFIALERSAIFMLRVNSVFLLVARAFIRNLIPLLPMELPSTDRWVRLLEIWRPLERQKMDLLSIWFSLISSVFSIVERINMSVSTVIGGGMSLYSCPKKFLPIEMVFIWKHKAMALRMASAFCPLKLLSSRNISSSISLFSRKSSKLLIISFAKV